MLRLCLVGLAAGWLTACAGWSDMTGLANPFEVSRPFEGAHRNTLATHGITRGASIRLGGISGLPQDDLDNLGTALERAAKANDIPLSSHKAATTAEILSGQAYLIEAADRRDLAIQWTLSSASLEPLNRFTIRTPLPLAPAIRLPGWAQGEAAMGTSGGDDLLGGLTSRTLEDVSLKTARGLRQILERAQGRDPETEIRRRSILILPVSGAPGDGRRSLTGSLELLLKDAGLPVRTLWDGRLPGSIPPDTLIVTARVLYRPLVDADSDGLRLTWTVRDWRGQSLGAITQTNLVAHGSLEPYWNEAAYFAAQGAVSGILDLLSRPVPIGSPSR